MDGGFIKMHRQIKDTWIWDNPKFLKWWIDLLFMANFDERQIIVGFKPMKLKSGQLRASVSFLMERWEYKKKHNIINFLHLLENDGMIKRETIGNTTIITICNYSKYQNKGNTEGSDRTDTTLGTTSVTTPDTTLGTTSVTQEEELKKVRTQDNNILTHTNACARIEKDEEAYVNEAKSSGEFLEQLQRKFCIYDAQRFVSLIDAFNTECKAYDKRHTSHKDFRQKFTWWVSDKLHGTFPSVQVVSSMLNAESIAPDWPLMEAYTGYFDLVRKANLTNYMYQLDILRPRQYADLVIERGFSPQEVWQATTELNNNVRYCRDHQSAYECLITFCQSSRNNPNLR